MENSEKQFERIVRESKDTVYTVCYMFSQDQDEVADLYQECLINLWHGLPHLDAGGNVRGWVYRVCLNTCISCRRKRRSRHTVPLTMDVTPFDAADRRPSQVSQLHSRIGRLQPFDRAIVLLWLENMPYDEIGAILGITAKNVSVRLYRIKEQLKNMSNQ